MHFLKITMSFGCLLATAAFLHGQANAKKEQKGEVEVGFANGSIVRIVPYVENLDIVTRYGKLVVPLKEIRRIEFGVHLPEGVDKKVATALAALAGENYKQREEAMRELVALGAYAYPAVHKATDSANLELATRAKEVAKRIQAKVPAKQLRLREDDEITSDAFTIVGQIVTPTLKAETEYFGQIELSLVSMRTWRALAGQSGDVDITVDAAKYANVGQWLATDYAVDGKSAIKIMVTGQVDLWPQGAGQYMSGPRGYNQQQILPPGVKLNDHLISRAYPGALLGRIGDNGDIFVIGDRWEGTPAGEGKLYMHIGPSPWNNASSGAYQVQIRSQ